MATEEKKWYVLRVISGKEMKVKSYIETEVTRSKWEHIVTQVLVPTEKIYKVKNGKKVIKDKIFYPGYMLLEADEKKMNADITQTIKSITGVIHFLGNNSVPMPLRKSEVNRLLGKVDEMDEMGSTLSEPFLVNESVKIIDGPFNDFIGTIEEVMEDKKKLKVVVKIFGRKTPVELNYYQVEKQS